MSNTGKYFALICHLSQITDQTEFNSNRCYITEQDKQTDQNVELSPETYKHPNQFSYLKKGEIEEFHNL